MKKIIITIDGPAASGKGSIASYISSKWKLKHLDSGILYRKIAQILLKKNVNLNSTNEIKMTVINKNFLSFLHHSLNAKEKRSLNYETFVYLGDAMYIQYL